MTKQSGYVTCYTFEFILEVLVARRLGARPALVCWQFDIRPNILAEWEAQYATCATEGLMELAELMIPKVVVVVGTD